MINSFLQPHLRREHNVAGAGLFVYDNIPDPKVEEPRSQKEKDLMKEIDKMFEDVVFTKKDPYKDHTRKNVLQKKGQKIEAMVLGKVRAYDKKELVESTASKKVKFQEIEKKLRELVKIHNPNFRYTSIQVNKAVETAYHFDRGNVGLSYCIAFGDFTGGGVIVRTKKGEKLYKNYHKWLYYDGHNIEHRTAPSKGTRYAVIYFTKS